VGVGEVAIEARKEGRKDEGWERREIPWNISSATMRHILCAPGTWPANRQTLRAYRRPSPAPLLSPARPEVESIGEFPRMLEKAAQPAVPSSPGAPRDKQVLEHYNKGVSIQARPFICKLRGWPSVRIILLQILRAPVLFSIAASIPAHALVHSLSLSLSRRPLPLRPDSHLFSFSNSSACRFFFE
jgi:hypothetical protein